MIWFRMKQRMRSTAVNAWLTDRRETDQRNSTISRSHDIKTFTLATSAFGSLHQLGSQLGNSGLQHTKVKLGGFVFLQAGTTTMKSSSLARLARMNSLQT